MLCYVMLCYVMYICTVRLAEAKLPPSGASLGASVVRRVTSRCGRVARYPRTPDRRLIVCIQLLAVARCRVPRACRTSFLDPRRFLSNPGTERTSRRRLHPAVLLCRRLGMGRPTSACTMYMNLVRRPSTPSRGPFSPRSIDRPRHTAAAIEAEKRAKVVRVQLDMLPG